MATALAQAFADAGHVSAQVRLQGLAVAALKARPRSLDLARTYLLREIGSDPELLWALFQRWERLALDLCLQTAAAQLRSERQDAEASTSTITKGRPPPPGGAGQVGVENHRIGARAAEPSAAEQAAARSHVAIVISKLDTFKVNNRPIGDCTPEEALAWSDARSRDVRFVRLLTAGLPPTLPIRRFITPDEAEAIYQRAQRELGNE